MLQITPQMKILVAVEPVDFRRGIDGLARLCQDKTGFSTEHAADSPYRRAHFAHPSSV